MPSTPNPPHPSVRDKQPRDEGRGRGGVGGGMESPVLIKNLMSIGFWIVSHAHTENQRPDIEKIVTKKKHCTLYLDFSKGLR